MPVRFVFFDFGGTLAYNRPGFGTPAEIWQRVAQTHGVDLSLPAIQAGLARADRTVGPRVYDYVGRAREFWTLYDAAVLEELGVVAPLDDWERALSAIFRDPDHVVVFPEAPEVLTELRTRGLRLGVISNYHDDLPILLRVHGLDRLLDTVTFSQEAGAEKPDRRVFDRALERAGGSASEAVHVGDSWDADYLGALGVGMRGIWLNRRGATPPRPCEQVTDLRGVVPLVVRGGDR